MKPLNSCTQQNMSLGTNYSEASSCSGGNAYQCYSLTPWAVSSKLSYGYAAVPARGDICGRCYQLQFTGASHNAGSDEGSRALAGKTMIVQAVNTGHDVTGGQFDILVPGGGVGAFNACSKQWGTTNLGEQYGGLLAACKRELGFGAGQAAFKSCLTQKCSALFSSSATSELAAGCKWYADWFEVADNPAIVYKEVVCPSEIVARSGMNRTPLNDVRSGCSQ